MRLFLRLPPKIDVDYSSWLTTVPKLYKAAHKQQLNWPVGTIQWMESRDSIVCSIMTDGSELSELQVWDVTWPEPRGVEGVRSERPTGEDNIKVVRRTGWYRSVGKIKEFLVVRI